MIFYYMLLKDNFKIIMSSELHMIVDAVNNEIKPLLPKLSSERQRIEMRQNLAALEKMCKHYRHQLLEESKTIKKDRVKRKYNSR
jgi:hypothetical protein